LSWPQVKTLYQKLIKIDILPSHVKLHKMLEITHSPEKKQKIHAKQILKNGSLAGKTDQNRENRKPIGFGFGLSFPQGSIRAYLYVTRRSGE
jgi:hypothetical protein